MEYDMTSRAVLSESRTLQSSILHVDIERELEIISSFHFVYQTICTKVLEARLRSNTW